LTVLALTDHFQQISYKTRPFDGKSLQLVTNTPLKLESGFYSKFLLYWPEAVGRSSRSCYISVILGIQNCNSFAAHSGEVDEDEIFSFANIFLHLL
jgi:hypothetical protein